MLRCTTLLAVERKGNRMTVHAQDATSHTYGSNYTIMPAHVTITRAQLDTARAHADAAPRELRPLYGYTYYDDAVTIYCPRADSFGETDWKSVGVILFAPVPGQSDLLEIYALEVGEGCERGDVEGHIPLLFGESVSAASPGQ